MKQTYQPKKRHRAKEHGFRLFESIEDVQQLTDEWLLDYNDYRPHDSLGGVPPTSYMPRPTAPDLSTFKVCP